MSMIPFLKDTEAFVGSCDLWTTSDQLFQMNAGAETAALATM